MVPFSFENIARSASFDASNALPVSEAARATHESFESHLQSSAATTVHQPTREPAQEDQPREHLESTSHESPRSGSNEPARQDVDEAPRDEVDSPVTSGTETATTSEKPDEPIDEDLEIAAVPNDEPLIFAIGGERQVASQAADADVVSDSDDNPESFVAVKRAAARPADEEPKPGGPFATNAEASADDEVIGSSDDAPVDKELKPARGERVDPAKTEVPVQRGQPPETNEQVASGQFPAATSVPEATNAEGEPRPASTTPQRHARRADISPSQPVDETPDAPQQFAANVIETAADTAGDDSARHGKQRQGPDAPQTIGHATSVDEATTTSATPSRFAQHLIARTEESNARSLNLTNADQARFVDRVARAVQATGDRGGTLRLRLSPPELGSLTLEVKVQGGVVSARVEADSPAARTLLLENVPLLRERIAEQGMRVDQFDVDLTDRHAGGTPDGLQQNDQQHEDRPQAKTALDEPDEPHTMSDETPTKNGNEQLNIIV